MSGNKKTDIANVIVILTHKKKIYSREKYHNCKQYPEYHRIKRYEARYKSPNNWGIDYG